MCHDVGVTLFVVWNKVKEAVDRLNRLDLNMKIHSEVRRGQFGPGETLVMQPARSAGCSRRSPACRTSLQKLIPAHDPPIRVALVTARNAPAHERVLHTLDAWDVRVDQMFMLGGLEKSLAVLKLHIFFDDQDHHAGPAAAHVPSVSDDGRLVVAHAGMKESMQNRASGAVRAFALFGETSGESDEFGLPVRHDWAWDYRGAASVVYGHTPVAEARWVNRTICIDTGCVFGGRLTALRWPERQLVSVPAARTYCDPVWSLRDRDAEGVAGSDAGTLNIGDVLGKRIIETRLHRTVTIREDNAAAALETMSRFAADPRWLIYLPPTMSPSETSHTPSLLEHPAEAFSYYRGAGIGHVVCEEKHMGSRAVVIACRDADAARRRFGADCAAGIVHTRTGRSDRWTTSGWRRSTCWRPRAAPMSTGTMHGTWKRSARSPRPARRSRRRLGVRLTSMTQNPAPPPCPGGRR
jgi:PNKP adenylyltransferase domain, ligase domain/5'-nucleotidase